MRKHIILLYLIILSASCFAQTVTKTVGIVYTAGAPAHAPAAKVGSQVAIDTATWEWYEYNGSAWIASGDRIQSISGCSAPNYTPTKYQSRLVINACTAGQGGPELYYWTGSVWLQINETYTAGTGISIVGSTITNTGDLSTTNEIQTLSIAGSNLSLSNGGGTVALPATGITSLGGQTGGTQTFATGTSGTDFAISSFSNTHTFNLPDASASNRGALTSANWTTFNNKVGGSGTAGQLPIFTAPNTIGGDADLTWDATTNTLLAGTSTALNSAYKLQVVGNATYRNAAFTTNETNNGFLDIRGGTMTAQSGAAHTLAGINLEGAMVFNTFNQTFSGIRVALTSNATASQNIRPLDVSYSSGTIGSAIINNTASAGTQMVLGGSNFTELLAIRTPGAGTAGAAAPGINYISTASNASWNLGSAQGGSFSIQTTSSGTNPNSVNGTFFVRDDKVSVGRYASPTYPATLSVKNPTGYSQFNLATTYTPTGSADALGATGDVSWDANYIYIKTASGWKRSALSTF